MESKVDDVVANLYQRITQETEVFLRKQLEILEVDITDDMKIDQVPGLDYVAYPKDPKALFSYHYRNRPILGARISENGMSIEWDIADPLTLARFKAEFWKEDQVEVLVKYVCDKCKTYLVTRKAKSVLCPNCMEPMTETQTQGEVQK